MKPLALVLLAALSLALNAAATPPSADSIYQLEPTLTNQDGARQPLDVYRGRPALISMFYATCPAACPLLISAIQRIEQQLPLTQRGQLRVMMISIDPARDTPAALKELAQKHRTDPARWSFMTAPAADVRQIAAVLGIQYRQRPDGEFNHSSVIILLDRDGNLVAQTSTLGREDPQFMAAMRQTLGPPGR